MSVLFKVLTAAETVPQQVAIKDSTRELTYAKLVNEVARFASGLLSQGVRHGDRVVIRMSTSVDALVVSFAAMWIGAIFVPLSPMDPPPRLASILGDCEPTVVVKRPSDRDVPEGSWGIVDFADLGHQEMLGLPSPSGGDSAYCIYTSGTTGTPKGVLVGHQGFAHAIHETIAAVGIDQKTRTLCISAFHFDGSFASLFSTLAAGGNLNILRREPTVLPRAFVRTVRDEKINLAFFAPSFLRLLLASHSLNELVDSQLTQIVSGGEKSATRHIMELFSTLPKVRFLNLYGPTETIIDVTINEITREDIDRDEIPIGVPHPGVNFALVDEHDKIIDQPEVIGELYIGGAQIMEGYWGDPELSSKVLRRDLIPGSVLYRTGDLAKRNDVGGYVYVGRVDRVIKRNGIRISLDEIERYLLQLPGVINAACVAITDDDGGMIIAYASMDVKGAGPELLMGLEKWLPRSMIPDALNIVRSIPLTSTGKTDYRSLVTSDPR